MDPKIIDGLIFYIGLVVLLTFHEFAHAWVAWLCGDDTARLQGRLSLNPIVHIDPIGTVVFPLLMIFSPIGGFLIGWAKPVPINLANLRNPVRDDVLIALAGPAMNLVLAVVLVALARVIFIFGSTDITGQVLHMASLSLLLCFFNLIPIPPLDGSHVLRNFIGMSWETYWNLCRYGIIGVWLVLRIPFVQQELATLMYGTLDFLMRVFGFPS
ncbi:MAG TPA: site-2 protease family protein [Candidatus Sulfotelmatobacter sp.]|nr:site-2 protease family protein [Candidatus Sulfotelmatobacter sp.]